jgi:hypothetical protein
MNALNYAMKNRINLEKEKKEIKREIHNIFKEKTRFNPVNNINRFAHRISLGNGKRIYRKEFNMKYKKAYDCIIKMRQGLFKLAGDYARTEKIKDELKDKCLSCRMDTKESIEHLILDCNAFEADRIIYINPLMELALVSAPTKPRDLTLSFILDGQMNLKCDKAKMKKIYMLKMEFLLKFIENRRMHILNVL